MYCTQDFSPQMRVLQPVDEAQVSARKFDSACVATCHLRPEIARAHQSDSKRTGPDRLCASIRARPACSQDTEDPQRNADSSTHTLPRTLRCPAFALPHVVLDAFRPALQDSVIYYSFLPCPRFFTFDFAFKMRLFIIFLPMRTQTSASHLQSAIARAHPSGSKRTGPDRLRASIRARPACSNDTDDPQRNADSSTRTVVLAAFRRALHSPHPVRHRRSCPARFPLSHAPSAADSTPGHDSVRSAVGDSTHVARRTPASSCALRPGWRWMSPCRPGKRRAGSARVAGADVLRAACAGADSTAEPSASHFSRIAAAWQWRGAVGSGDMGVAQTGMERQPGRIPTASQRDSRARCSARRQHEWKGTGKGRISRTHGHASVLARWDSDADSQHTIAGLLTARDSG
ncbi:hypothetical protein B0H10DRAFT_2201665 [Mycena sp. CBHHK59/15]|nr:hypothetical protein B0H10DRAFT_2201665 [Mycena sp. CBHHK59/15]